MLNTFSKKAVVAATALFVLAAGVGTAIVQAQPRGPVGGRAGAHWQAPRAAGLARLGLAIRALDLTDEQRTQVRTILEQHRDETRAVAEKARAAREQMRAIEGAATLNQEALQVAAASLAETQVAGAVLRAKIRSEVLAVLTPEQRQKAEQMRAQAQERQRQRMERLKARRPGVI